MVYAVDGIDRVDRVDRVDGIDPVCKPDQSHHLFTGNRPQTSCIQTGKQGLQM
jgi:hypothetical protein